MPNKPTVQDDLLAACRTCVESIDGVFGDYPVTSGLPRWTAVHAAKRLAERAIERAESEAKDE